MCSKKGAALQIPSALLINLIELHIFFIFNTLTNKIKIQDNEKIIFYPNHYMYDGYWNC